MSRRAVYELDVYRFYIQFLYQFESLAGGMSNKFAIYRLLATNFQYTWLDFFVLVTFPEEDVCELM